MSQAQITEVPLSPFPSGKGGTSKPRPRPDSSAGASSPADGRVRRRFRRVHPVRLRSPRVLLTQRLSQPSPSEKAEGNTKARAGAVGPWGCAAPAPCKPRRPFQGRLSGHRSCGAHGGHLPGLCLPRVTLISSPRAWFTLPVSGLYLPRAQGESCFRTPRMLQPAQGTSLNTHLQHLPQRARVLCVLFSLCFLANAGPGGVVSKR